MQAQRLTINTDEVVPLMAVLPYSIVVDDHEEGHPQYDPHSQLTVFAGRNFSTCRQDESVGFLTSKSDTQKDD
jgi:hypothetical protein